MKFVLALAGAVGSLWLLDIANGVFVFIAGGVLGWLMGLALERGDRLAALERKLATLEKSRELERAPMAKAAPAQEAAPPQGTAPTAGAVPTEITPTAAVFERARAEGAVPAAFEPAPSAPAEPGIVERAFAYARDWFLTGNVPVKVGVLISFVGVGFLLDYATSIGLLSVEFWLAFAAVAAIAMLAFGWRVRDRNRVYALSVQGGGIGVLYLTVFAAFRLYQLLPPLVAFALLVLLTLAASALAVLQRAQPLAVLGTVAGFAAPLLVSTGSGNYVALFSYYLVLNLAVAGIAWFMAWRVLNLVGFLFTFAIGAAWGAKYYKLENFATVEPFLLAYFAVYLAVAVLFALRHGPAKGGFVDGTLVFGLPVVAFAYQAELVEPFANFRALSAVGAGIIYGALAAWLLRRREEGARLLCEAFLVLSVGFGTLAIPLALDAQWTSAAWALEGAGLVWVGLRQSRRLAQLSGVALQLVAAAVLLVEYRELAHTPIVVNSRTLGGTLIALSLLYSGAAFQRLAPQPAPASTIRAVASVALVVLGAAWWYFSWLLEIEFNAPELYELSIMLVFLAGSALAFHGAARRAEATRLEFGAAALVFMLAWQVIAWADVKRHPVQDFGFLAWPMAFAAQFWLVDRFKAWHAAFAEFAGHVALWLVAVLVAWQAHWSLRQVAPLSVWAWSGATLALVLVGHLAARHLPATPFASLARLGALVPLIAGLVLVFAFQLVSRGDPRPLSYLPLANPLDLVTLAAGGAMLLWYRTQGAALGLAPAGDRAAWTGLAVLGFTLVTMTTVRAFHHWAAMPHDFDDVMRHDGLQAALSIVWATLGVTAMFAGARGAQRAVWMAGAALMGVVVAKLFLVDLGNTDTVARIVSFIGVGALLLVIGWFAPLPARAVEAKQ